MNQAALANLILGGVIALLPLYTRIGHLDFARTSKDNLFLVICMAIMPLLPGKVRTAPVPMWLLLVYTIINVVLNQYNVLSVTVMMQSFYIVGGITLFIAYYERHDEKSLHYILDGMAIGCMIQSLLGIGNYFNFDIYERAIMAFKSGVIYVPFATTREVTGSLGHSNLLGSYLAITMASLFRPKWIWLLPLPVIALAAAQSMMGLGAAIAACFYFLNAQYNIIDRFWVYTASAWGMFTIFYTGLGGIDSQRFDAWRKIFSWVDLKHFLFGMGPGWFVSKRLMLTDGLMAQEHSGFISIFNVLGILAFVIAAPFLIKFLFKRDHDSIFTASLFAAFCSSFGHFTFHQSTVAIIILVVASICLAEGNNHEFDLER